MTAQRPGWTPLIVIQEIDLETGEVEDVPLFGLVTAARDRRLRDKLDMDYVRILASKLESDNDQEAEEAAEALRFLNAYAMALGDANFKHLQAIGKEVTQEFKRAIYSERNTAQRDYLGNLFPEQRLESRDPETPYDVLDEIEGPTLGEVVDQVKAAKRQRRRDQKKMKGTKKK